MTLDERIDEAVEKMLRAAGNPRLGQYMPSTQAKLREAMREILILGRSHLGDTPNLV